MLSHKINNRFTFLQLNNDLQSIDTFPIRISFFLGMFASTLFSVVWLAFQTLKSKISFNLRLIEFHFSFNHLMMTNFFL